MRVSATKIYLALARLDRVRGCFSHHDLDIVATGLYDSGTDTWDISEKDAHRVEMLCGPYYETIIKAWEARCGTS